MGQLLEAMLASARKPLTIEPVDAQALLRDVKFCACNANKIHNQVGDIKLDLNMEYRTKMFWVLEGLYFLMEIWTIKEYEEQGGHSGSIPS